MAIDINEIKKPNIDIIFIKNTSFLYTRHGSACKLIIAGDRRISK